MKVVTLLLFCIVFSRQTECIEPSLAGDAGLVARWMANQQFRNPKLSGYGAIKNADGVAAKDSNDKSYCCVSPYSANLGVLGLLQAGVPEGIPVAGHWIDWFFAHLNPQSAPDGVPYNHFCGLNGEGETTCVKLGDRLLCHYNDATDSAVATFFSVLWAAHEAGAPATMLNSPERRRQIERLAEVLLKLQQPDGLCWAKKLPREISRR